ncbi:MAG: hypothetical protein V1721_08480 [Pseudomonadota bacterium]
MNRKTLPAYAASFGMGFWGALRNRQELASSVVIYVVLLICFRAICETMPIEELGIPGLTRAHLLWYLAMTECVIVSAPGLAEFGQMIADGRLTEMMRRPCGMMGLALSRMVGAHLARAVVLFVFALAVMPYLTGVSMPVAPLHAPLLIVSLVLGILLFELFGYALGTLEVLGPYSRPAGWIISKFIFAFGGLFFPVSFFPPLLREIVLLTPFPAVIFVPGSFMLMPDTPSVLEGIGTQVFWLAAIILVASFASRRMVRHVLEKGD